MNPRSVALTPEDGAVMRAIQRRRGDFVLLNMATMDKVDAGIMRRHEMAKHTVIGIPRWRRRARLPGKVTGSGPLAPVSYLNRWPSSDCGNRSPINSELMPT